MAKPKADGGRVKGLSILGSTGSIGRNALEIARKNPARFRVVALSAGANLDLLKKQIDEFSPRYVSVLSESGAKEIKKYAPSSVYVGSGVKGAVNAASFDGVDVTVSAISGAAGLVPTMAAIKAGKDVALANKETLVMAGPIVMKEAAKRGVKLMPVDSEHSAIFQALSGHRREDIKRLILTASGGPFLKTPMKRLGGVTPAQALNHPRWKMGKKISIDSATLMNKGLEVIEARWLFDVPAGRISVTVHPQSVVHSMVEYVDGSIVAQMGVADMKGPIAYALSYPERIASSAPALDLKGLRLDFAEPDLKRFPCLALAYGALERGGAAPAMLNAADEVAVEAFLKGVIGFTGIHRVIAGVLDAVGERGVAEDVQDIVEADLAARKKAVDIIKATSEKRYFS